MQGPLVSSLTLETEGMQRTFYFREKTSDEGVLRQVFHEQQYAFNHWQRLPELMNFIKQRSAEHRRPLVVDGGANIGASVVYFAAKIPAAHVVAIEPAEDNFHLLQRNTSGLDVDLRLGALGATGGHATVVDPGLGHWGYQTRSVRSGGSDRAQIPIVLLNDIYSTCGARYFPFLVKLDIEGAEKEVFSENTEWVGQTPIIIVEPHDWLLPRQETVRSFLRLMVQERRDILIQGENIVAISHELL